MPARLKFWALCLTSAVVVEAASSFLLRPHGRALTAVSDSVQCALLLGATVLCLLNFSKSSRRTRLFWLLMGLGLGSWLSYQALWTYIEVVERQEVPNLFAGDAILFLHLVPMMAALGLQANIEQDKRDLRLGALDFALLLLWWL